MILCHDTILAYLIIISRVYWNSLVYDVQIVEEDELPYKILTAKNIDELILQRTLQVAEDIGVSYDMARALLIKNQWNRKNVVEATSNDPDYMKTNFKFDPDVPAPPNERTDGKFDCAVCYDEYEDKDRVQIEECGHTACNECIKDFVNAKLQDG